MKSCKYKIIKLRLIIKLVVIFGLWFIHVKAFLNE